MILKSSPRVQPSTPVTRLPASTPLKLMLYTGAHAQRYGRRHTGTTKNAKHTDSQTHKWWHTTGAYLAAAKTKKRTWRSTTGSW